MKKHLAFLFICWAYFAGAQLNYTFTSVAGTYNANASPTNIFGSGVDDQLSGNINIGFTFQFGCTNYTQFKASSNGVMFLGTSATASNAFNDLSGSSDRPALAPLWDDLMTDAAGSVNYQLTGTSPNRVLTVEWKEMLWTYSGTTWAISFQTKLYETSNIVEFVYTRNGAAGANITASASASIGISGPTTNDFYSLDAVSASPNCVYGTETDNLNSKPTSGRVYRFTPVQCSGTPTAGTVNATVTSGCSGYTSVLSLSGQSTGCGITYQWQSSPNNSTWSNVAGATSSSYTATVASTIYYHCVVTCTNGGASATTGSATLTVVSNCYTMSNTNVNIGSCPFSGMFFDSGGSGSPYSNSETYTKTFTAPAGSCLTFSFTAFQTESCCDDLTIYDGPNTASPVIGVYAGTTSPGTFTSSGTSVTFAWSSDFSSTDIGWAANISCAPGCSGTPTAGTATANPTALACGQTTTLTVSGNTTGCGITYQWQSSPNNSTWTNIAGATSYTYATGQGSNTYYRCVISCGAANASSTSIYVTSPAGPPNDNCTTATTLTVGTCVGGDVTCASQSQAACLGTANDDIWYSFVATNSNLNISVFPSASFDPVVQLFSGGCGSLTSVFCDDASFTSGTSGCRNVTGLSVGATYYIRVYDYYTGYPATTTFSLCVARPSAATYTCNLNYTTSTIARSIDGGVSTSVPGISDDHISNAIPIGFNFCFDGYQYARVFISSNASLVFDAVDPCVPNVDQTREVAANGIATGYVIDGPAPTTTDYCPQNAVLGPWHDIDPSKGGTITYATLGTSPNRRFVVYFNAVKQFYSTSPCQNNSYDYTGQLKLYETSNNVEIHITQMNSCAAWNEGQAILGLHNAFGTLAVVPAGYNAVASPGPYNVYSISNAAWRFSPNCAGCSIILPVELMEFTAKKKDTWSNEIFWATVVEENVKSIHLERSPDGHNFSRISSMAPKSATGSSYTYVDNLSEKDQTYYYRLVIENRNGEISHSGLRVIERGKSFTTSVLSVYPNPFVNYLNVDIESLGENAAFIEIVDITGRTLLKESLTLKDGTNNFILDGLELTNGLYLVRIKDVEGNPIFTKKVVKE